jgi:hypothetical protein
MKRLTCLLAAVVLAGCSNTKEKPAAPPAPAPGSYLFVWSGDDDMKSGDFIAVVNADAASPQYGRVVASLAVSGPSGTPHHTEMEMPAGGVLAANAFGSGQTFLFDLRDPLSPRLVNSFGDFEGFTRPHSFARLPNGNMLATFQYRGGHEPKSEGGGLVEIDTQGKFIRAASAMDSRFRKELIRPYSLLVLSELDRVVSTNTAMNEADGSSRTVQVWRLSDLKLLHTLILPPGPRKNVQEFPGEPIAAADGKSVFIHTFSCGLYEMSKIDSPKPETRFIFDFGAKQCDVPLRLGRYWVQSVSTAHTIVSLDVSDPAHPREVSRLTFDNKQGPHWIAADPAGRRILVNSGENAEHRMFIVDFDPATGRLRLDERFRDPGSTKPGVSWDGKTWPHGFQGNAYPHGAVFSR